MSATAAIDGPASGPWAGAHGVESTDAAWIPWLDVLTAEQRDWACGEIRCLVFPSEALIFRQGGLSPGWVGVLDGLVRIASTDESGRTTTIAGFLPGSWFGEGTILKRKPCRYFVDALRVSRVAMLPAGSFHVLLEQSLGFNRFVLNQLNERLSMFIASREWERFKEPHLRVARHLSQLCGSMSFARSGVKLKVRQHEIAELAGLSRQCVNTALAELGHRGILRVQYGNVVVLDLPALATIRA